MLAEYLQVYRCAYAEVEAEAVFVITGDHVRTVPSIVGRWEVAAFGAACVRAMLAGVPFVVADTDADPAITAADLPAYRATNIRAGICVPLHKKGRFTAAMGVHQSHPRYWTSAEVTLVQLVVGRCWEALDRQHLDDLYEHLREPDRRKDEFLATLAHELRNPLAPVCTGLQVLQLSPDEGLSDRTRQMMQRQLGHLVHMVDDLLDVSRITLGKLTLKLTRLDFRAVLHSALETTRPLIEARGHELSIRLAQEALPLDADATRLTQVIANLLNNAAKYTPPGGRIQLLAETEGETLIVRIQDTGVGIPQEMPPSVFEMFIQVGRSVEHAQGGLGIGLTLVRRLVELHGGSIEAHSPGPGLGSTFVLQLPLSEGVPQKSGAVLPAAAHAGSVTLRILIVDDNVDAADSLAMLLNLGGHDVCLAHDGTTALATAREQRPDVILLDIGLPGLNGYEVAAELRKDAGSQPFLIALTGWGSEEDRRSALEAGFDEHLVKPADIAALYELLGRVVARGKVTGIG